MSRPRRPPTCATIAKVNSEFTKTLPNLVGCKDCSRACWACGDEYPTGHPERAHVVAVRHDGSDCPTNFFLLCSHCHKAQPDAASRNVQEEWIRCAEPVWSRRMRQLQALKAAIEPIGLPNEPWVAECAKSIVKKTLSQYSVRAGWIEGVVAHIRAELVEEKRKRDLQRSRE